MLTFFSQLLTELKNTKLIEFIAVISGIVSVWYSKKENILVYPTGLANTIIYVYLSFQYGLFGEASVNLYYTIMSVYGWILWSRKDSINQSKINIEKSTLRQWLLQIAFCSFFYVAIYLSLSYLRNIFNANTIPWADAFASSTAYTGMWLMARKKIESWYWWMATNTASIPLYYVKGLAFTSFYYLILLVLAFLGLREWLTRWKDINNKRTFV